MTNLQVPFIINGQESHTSSSFDVVSPITGEKVHRGGVATEADAISAVNSAAKSFKDWRHVSPSDRRDILFKAAALLIERQDELVAYMVDEIGSPRGYAIHNVIKSAELIRDVAGRISSLQGFVPTCADRDLTAIVVKEPYGVVLAIAPW